MDKKKEEEKKEKEKTQRQQKVAIYEASKHIIFCPVIDCFKSWLCVQRCASAATIQS